MARNAESECADCGTEYTPQYWEWLYGHDDLQTTPVDNLVCNNCRTQPDTIELPREAVEEMLLGLDDTRLDLIYDDAHDWSGHVEGLAHALKRFDDLIHDHHEMPDDWLQDERREIARKYEQRQSAEDDGFEVVK